VTEKSKNRGPIPVRGGRLISLPKHQAFEGPPTLLLITNEYWDSFPEVKQPGPEPDHSPPHVMLRFRLPHAFMVYTGTLLSLLLMKQQFVTTHTIPQTKIPALLNRWVTNTHSVKMWFPQKKLLLLIFS
jgi:hypothetical protein